MACVDLDQRAYQQGYYPSLIAQGAPDMSENLATIGRNLRCGAAVMAAIAALAIGMFMTSEGLANSAQSIPGRATAEMICGRCHDIGMEKNSDWQRGDGTAPAFVMIARDPRMTRATLRRFIRFPHGAMESVFITQRETDALVAYIESLKPDGVQPRVP